MEDFIYKDNLKRENIRLREKINLYEISSKIDYQKIEKLKEEIIYLKSLLTSKS